jgi:integrase
MPRRAKGPRLYLKQRAGREAVWIIRDGQVEVGTGCGAGRMPDAEQRLGEYILAKLARDGAHQARSKRDPAQVGVAEVLALYAAERAPQLKADPKSTAGFVKHLVMWWGDAMVADVKRSTCKAYVAHRTAEPIRHGATGRMVSEQTARRELETLSAAIGYWHGEDTLTTRPVVWLPEKPGSPRDALTRSQAAALLKAALGYRRGADGRWTRLSASARANRAHLRRFILIGLYTGTRHSAIRALLWHESPHQAWVDLDKGMIYRRGKSERDSATKRRPVVKLPGRLLAHMRRWRRLDQFVDANKKVGASHTLSAVTSVLHHGGQPIASKIRRGFAACVADAGLPEEVTPHWMRHTCATWLMERGAEMWEAAAYTGMTTAVLEKHYGHHRPDHQAGAIRALGGKR